VSDTLVVRERFSLDDRTFTVLAESWFDAESSEWRGRLLYIPLDRSLARGVASGAVKRSRRRDDLVRQLGVVTDRDIAKAFRAIPLSPPRRPRGR
jgi:hypothetical protein